MDGAETPGTLDDPAKSECYYKFEGTKGELLLISTGAKVGGDPFDTSYLDTVVTLFDDTKTQIAQNDDPIPRNTNDATIYTVLAYSRETLVPVLQCLVPRRSDLMYFREIVSAVLAKLRGSRA